MLPGIAYCRPFTTALFAPLADAPREMAVVAYLTRDGDLLGLRHMTGERDHLRLPIRSIAIDALALDARTVVMAHNHPSGDPTPSDADYSLTRRLSRGLDALGIRLFDHIVLAGPHSVSLRERGYL